jgi:hypothetical protein
MSQIKIWMALTVLGGLFLLTGVQSLVYAQGANDTSAAMGAATENATNATAWMGNATNATGTGNETGNISGFGPLEGS